MLSAQFSFSFSFSFSLSFSEYSSSSGSTDESSEAPWVQSTKTVVAIGIYTNIHGFQGDLVTDPTEFLREGCNSSELVPSLATGPRLNSGAIFYSTKGKSHSTQASTFDFAVQLWFLLRLLRLKGSFLFVKNSGIKLNTSCSVKFLCFWYSLHNCHSSRPV